MNVRFLLDENLPPSLSRGLARREPGIHVTSVGDPGAPSRGSQDPEVLDYAEVSRRILVTMNRRSLAEHLKVHRRGGGCSWGVLWVDPQARVPEIVDCLLLIWSASEAEEWMDVTLKIPF